MKSLSLRPDIHIPSDDALRLRLLADLRFNTGATHETLESELARARILPRHEIAADVVVVNSAVRFADLGSGDEETYVLAWPESADAVNHRLSVLAPIGTALLGLKTGDEIDWPTPGGIRRLRVLEVEPPAAVGA